VRDREKESVRGRIERETENNTEKKRREWVTEKE